MWKAREEVVIMVQLYSANYGLKTLLIPHCSLCNTSALTVDGQAEYFNM